MKGSRENPCPDLRRRAQAPAVALRTGQARILALRQGQMRNRTMEGQGRKQETAVELQSQESETAVEGQAQSRAPEPAGNPHHPSRRSGSRCPERKT